MDHPARVSTRADGKVLFFDESNLEAAQRKVTGNTRAVDASADNDHVETGLRSRRAVHRSRVDHIAEMLQLPEPYAPGVVKHLARRRGFL